jgi:hypothetical protein
VGTDWVVFVVTDEGVGIILMVGKHATMAFLLSG